MKKVGVREFRDHATKYLASDEVLAIDRHGRTIGFYVPTAHKPGAEFHESLKRLEDTVQKFLTETGLTENELADLFDLTKPLPETIPSRRRTKPAKLNATGG